ncbi:MAG: response regulator transcription factor [Bacteroidales bacterium]|jgi:DNA-binding LytR/AlgR family response regulator|nr:response regulator transcription factor [Bacteroidales bacterium]
MKLKCIVVDDEPLAITIIRGYLKKIPFIEVVGTFESAIPVYEFLKNNHVDLLFLDVEMPSLTGIDFIKSLSSPPKVILTTANKNYAIEGFDLNVEDYILKPVSFDRLLKSANRIYENLSSETSLEDIDDEKNYIYLKENKKMVKVYFENILYLESLKDYVKVVTSCKTVLTKQLLSYFEKELDPNSFLRIHRSYIVAINKIDAYSLSGVDIGETEIPIGRKYKESAIEVLDDLNRIENN